MCKCSTNTSSSTRSTLYARSIESRGAREQHVQAQCQRCQSWKGVINGIGVERGTAQACLHIGLDSVPRTVCRQADSQHVTGRRSIAVRPHQHSSGGHMGRLEGGIGHIHQGSSSCSLDQNAECGQLPTFGLRSTRTMWFSVPPDTSLNPLLARASASACMTRRQGTIVLVGRIYQHSSWYVRASGRSTHVDARMLRLMGTC